MSSMNFIKKTCVDMVELSGTDQSEDVEKQLHELEKSDGKYMGLVVQIIADSNLEYAKIKVMPVNFGILCQQHLREKK